MLAAVNEGNGTAVVTRRTPPSESGMPTPAQYTSIGSVLAALVPCLMWLSDLPLKPLSDAQAAAWAVVLMGIVGLVHTTIQTYISERGNVQ